MTLSRKVRSTLSQAQLISGLGSVDFEPWTQLISSLRLCPEPSGSARSRGDLSPAAVFTWVGASPLGVATCTFHPVTALLRVLPRVDSI